MISDAAADIGITPDQWSRVLIAQGEIKAINQAHNDVLNSEEFKYRKTRRERENIIESHKALVTSKRSLLLKLLSLSSSEVNPEINGDIDDWFEEFNLSKRVCRRLRRSYYNALARQCLNELDVDPLCVFGDDADHIILNIKKVPFHMIGEIRIGNKIYRVTHGDSIDISESKL